MSAAHWVYQFSILSFIVNMMSVPYNSIIIARERMNIYAYIGMAEVTMKLLIAYLLFIIAFDKLKIYAVLYFGIVLMISSSYYFYSRVKYPESKFSWFWSKPLFREMMGFSIWSLCGSFAEIARGQGINILLGMFFNPVVNAARAIAYQVNNAINQFSYNFFTSVRPQITKQYAAGENKSMMNLVFRSSRFSFYLLFIFALPIMLETPYVLNLWLINPPDQSVLFTRLVTFASIIDSMSYPFMTAVNATGNIKYYQIVTGGILILTLPISYILLKLGYPPESTMYVVVGISAISQISRIVFMRILQNMSVLKYFKEVVFIVMSVIILSSATPFVVYRLLPYGNMRFIIVLAVSIVSCIFFIYTTGITKIERSAIITLVMEKVKINA